MLATPYHDRLEKLERQIEAENRAKEQMDPEKFEQFAFDFHKAMVDSNMIAPKWGRSYRKVPNGS
jgi:hypothetical protein